MLLSKGEEINGKICKYMFVLFQSQLKQKKEGRNRGREEGEEGRKSELYRMSDALNIFAYTI